MRLLGTLSAEVHSPKGQQLGHTDEMEITYLQVMSEMKLVTDNEDRVPGFRMVLKRAWERKPFASFDLELFDELYEACKKKRTMTYGAALGGDGGMRWASYEVGSNPELKNLNFKTHESIGSVIYNQAALLNAFGIPGRWLAKPEVTP